MASARRGPFALLLQAGHHPFQPPEHIPAVFLQQRVARLGKGDPYRAPIALVRCTAHIAQLLQPPDALAHRRHALVHCFCQCGKGHWLIGVRVRALPAKYIRPLVVQSHQGKKLRFVQRFAGAGIFPGPPDAVHGAQHLQRVAVLHFLHLLPLFITDSVSCYLY